MSGDGAQRGSDHAVVFDLGGVICAFHPDRRLRALSDASGLPAGLVHDAIWGSGLDARAEQGGLTPDETFEAVSKALDGRLARAALRAAWSHAFVPDESVCRLVQSVRAPRYVFTDNGPIVTDCLSHELESVALLVERVVCSWEVQACKPDPVAFERLARQLQRSPSEITFIDDTEANCQAAASTGMRALHFRDASELRRRLVQMDLVTTSPARAPGQG
ncbi:MAG: HAD family hydrolase [Acidimicrobiales bacterium]